jgi:hypothetical protein
MQEKRKLKRGQMTFYLGVYVSESKIPLGFVENIHSEGLMLRSDSPIETGKIYSLRMELPQQMGRKTQIDFSAECLWCKKENDTDFYKAGFRLMDINEELVGIINELIGYFGSGHG